ncbi:hypothetical protein EDD29_6333 [Actinocorallia herbida]|uniref:Uncharacterized protein n=1 Tax=Actinocorallia herbida TaxID=58109 RepID=A0A3N1D598_9ACTN|nr:hypothetical protein [Actinocorallia herbida]ROO88659.1 hypothetical protein EDD29_6333 [Actinocorallia herbida]
MAIPSDAELDTLIRARLALVGVDLDQLPETADPATGSPTRAAAMESLRTFLAGPKVNGVRQGGRPAALSFWTPPATGADALAKAQQAAPPLLYPSITEAWTEEGR